MPQHKNYRQGVDNIDVYGAIEYARRRMKRELSPNLTYHSFDHTFNEVLPATLSLGDVYHLPHAEMALLAIAAAFHDIGWVIQGEDHEEISVAISREILRGMGFKSEAIDKITGMIMATKLPQSPTNPLEEILVDADLDVLGREDYWPRSEDLRNELAFGGEIVPIADWYVRQKNFLESHTYYTTAAQILRNKQKKRNLLDLNRRLALLSESERS